MSSVGKPEVSARQVRSGGAETSPESAGFFDKVKEFWEDLRE